MGFLQTILADPRTRGMSIDDPRTTLLRRAIVRQKPMLRKVYEEWYRRVAAYVPAGPEPALELGSGAGFLKEFIPNLVTSEIFPVEGVDVVLDGQRMGLPDNSLRAVVMTDVLHHLPTVRAFFSEATRCVKPGGVIAMTEPWVTPWSKFIYRNFHHEPFEVQAGTWEFPMSGPLSGANGALPWILFVRDREKFEKEFPAWTVEVVRPFMTTRYLLSGGVSMRALVPNWSYSVWKGFDELTGRWMGMFALVVLRKKS